MQVRTVLAELGLHVLLERTVPLLGSPPVLAVVLARQDTSVMLGVYLQQHLPVGLPQESTMTAISLPPGTTVPLVLPCGR
jgi:hypothetical protein